MVQNLKVHKNRKAIHMPSKLFCRLVFSHHIKLHISLSNSVLHATMHINCASISFLSIWFSVLACGRGKLLFMWLFKNHWANIRISDVDHILRWWNYIKEIPVSNTKMGCRWRCWQKTLGMLCSVHINFPCDFVIFMAAFFILHWFLFSEQILCI